MPACEFSIIALQRCMKGLYLLHTGSLRVPETPPGAIGHTLGFQAQEPWLKVDSLGNVTTVQVLHCCKFSGCAAHLHAAQDWRVAATPSIIAE